MSSSVVEINVGGAISGGGGCRENTLNSMSQGMASEQWQSWA